MSWLSEVTQLEAGDRRAESLSLTPKARANINSFTFLPLSNFNYEISEMRILELMIARFHFCKEIYLVNCDVVAPPRTGSKKSKVGSGRVYPIRMLVFPNIGEATLFGGYNAQTWEGLKFPRFLPEKSSQSRGDVFNL